MLRRAAQRQSSGGRAAAHNVDSIFQLKRGATAAHLQRFVRRGVQSNRFNYDLLDLYLLNNVTVRAPIDKTNYPALFIFNEYE